MARGPDDEGPPEETGEATGEATRDLDAESESKPESESESGSEDGSTTADLDMGREALLSLVAKLTMAGFGFAGVVIFARVLGPVGVGGYYFALAVSLTLVRVSAGVGKTIKKRVSEVDVAPARFLGLGLAFHAVYFLAVAAGVLAVGAVWDRLMAVVVDASEALAAAVPVVPVFTPPEVSGTAALGVLAVFGTIGLFQVLNRFYAGIGYPGRSFWVDTVRSVLTLALQLVFLLVFDLGGVGLLFGLAGATLVSAVLVAALAALAGVVPRLPDRETVASAWSFARYAVPTSVVTDFYKRADVLLIGLFAGYGATGFYETALKLVTPADQVAASVSNPLAVKASGRSSLGEDVREDLSNAFTYTGLFGVPMFFGALAMPDALMQTFFGPAFRDAGVALVGIAAFFVFHIYQMPLVAAIEGTDRPRVVYRVKRAALVGHLLIAVPLAAVYGLLGVVGATLVVEVAMLLAYQWIARDLFGGVVVPRPLFSQLAAGVVMFGVVWTLKGPVPLTGWPSVVTLVGVGAGVYFTTLLVASAHFRLTLRNVLGPAYRRVRATI